VQRFLGHHSPAFTMSVYVHMLDKDDTPTLDSAIELPASLREFAAAPGRA
jgi:hypothetical protein